MHHEEESSGNWLLTVVICSLFALVSLWFYHHADGKRQKVDVPRAAVAWNARQIEKALR